MCHRSPRPQKAAGHARFANRWRRIDGTQPARPVTADGSARFRSNFDALGKWRTASDGQPIDATAALPDGTEFRGVAGLRALVASQREDFVRTFTGKLLAYAIGRGIEYYDLPAVRAIETRAAADDYRWSSLIAGIVRSVPFSMSRARSGLPEQRADTGAIRQP
jgi:hypothetical protein